MSGAGHRFVDQRQVHSRTSPVHTRTPPCTPGDLCTGALGCARAAAQESIKRAAWARSGSVTVPGALVRNVQRVRVPSGPTHEPAACLSMAAIVGALFVGTPNPENASVPAAH